MKKNTLYIVFDRHVHTSFGSCSFLSKHLNLISLSSHESGLLCDDCANNLIACNMQICSF